MRAKPLAMLIIKLLSAVFLLVTIFILHLAYKNPQVASTALDMAKVKCLDTYMLFYEELFLEKKIYTQPTKVGIFLISPKVRPQEWQEELTKYYDWEKDNFAEASAWPPVNEKILAIETEDQEPDILITDNSKGWEKLKFLDENGDGVLDKNDRGFSRLKVWVSTEPRTIEVTSHDNLFPLSKYYTSLNIDEARLSPVSNSDEAPLVRLVYLRTQKENSKYINKDLKLDVRTLFLPTLRGYGLLPDLHLAMSKDQILMDKVVSFTRCDLFSILRTSGENEELVSILYRWAQVDGIDKNIRGPFIDGRKLAFIEKIMAREYFSRDGEKYNPRIRDARLLEGIWKNAYLQQSTRLILQTCGKTLNANYNVLTDRISLDPKGAREEIETLLSESNKLNEDEKIIFKQNLKNMLSVLRESATPEDIEFFNAI